MTTHPGGTSRGRSRSFWSKLRPHSLAAWLAPTLTAAVLAVSLVYLNLTHRPSNWDDYHALATSVINENVATSLEGPSGLWIGRDLPMRQPNAAYRPPLAARRIEFINFSPSKPGDLKAERVEAVIVLVSRDNEIRRYWPESPARWSGQSPPVGEGRLLYRSDDRSIRVNGSTFDGRDEWIAGTLIVPARRGGGTTAGDFEAFYYATRGGGEYQQRRRGAAAVTISMSDIDAALPERVKLQVVTDVMRALEPTLEVLLGNEGASPEAGVGQATRQLPQDR